MAMKVFLYTKAPDSFKDMLIKKFPQDFGEVLLLMAEYSGKVDLGEESRLFILMRAINTVLEGKKSSSSVKIKKNVIERLANIRDRARTWIVQAYQPLVEKLARKYERPDVERSDLIQEGNEALLDASEVYEPRGYRFGTYAKPFVRKKIVNFLNRFADSYRKPHEKVTFVRKLAAALPVLEETLGHQPSLREIATYFEVSVGEVIDSLQLMTFSISLQTPVGKDGTEELGDFIEDERSPDPFAEVAHGELRNILESALQQLSKQERRIIELHYNLKGEGEYSLESVRKQLGLKRAEARLLLQLAQNKIKDYLRENTQGYFEDK